jgi:lipoprotein signal peptidase
MPRVRIVIVLSTLLAAVDLVQKATRPVYGHPRSAGYAVVAAAICLAIYVFVPRVPSRGLAVAGGIAAAGVLGNLVSALAWRNGVPNPIVTGGIAFNIADVLAVTGACGLVAGAVVFALRNPALLRTPI